MAAAFKQAYSLCIFTLGDTHIYLKGVTHAMSTSCPCLSQEQLLVLIGNRDIPVTKHIQDV